MTDSTNDKTGRSAFQQQNGWSLSSKSRSRGQTVPGNLLGISEQRNPLVYQDAPVSPGTRVPQADQSDNYFDSAATSKTAPQITSTPRNGYGSQANQPSLSSVAPWEASSGPTSNPFGNSTMFGTYNEVWSGDNRPGTARTYTSESLSSSNMDSNHKRSISDRFRQGHLRHNSRNDKSSEKGLGLARVSSSNGSIAPRTRGQQDLQTPSRPKTPGASREVAPWDYQEPTNHQYSNPTAPPPMPELTRFDSQTSEASPGQRRGMFGHKNRGSRDEGRSVRSQASSTELSDRSRLSTKQSRSNLNPFTRRQTESLRPSVVGSADAPRPETRGTSPSPSFRIGLQNSQSDSIASGKKTGLLGRIGNKFHLGSSSNNDDQNASPYASSPAYTPSPASMSRTVFNDPSGFLAQGPVEPFPHRPEDPAQAISASSRKESSAQKKDGTKRSLFHRDKNNPSRRLGTSDGANAREKGNRPAQDGKLFQLDQDFQNMDDIIDVQGQSEYVIVQGPGGSYFDNPAAFTQANVEGPGAVGATAWDAPDSWGWKKPEEIAPPEKEEVEVEPDDDDALTTDTYCIRVFRIDGTFSTLALPLNSSVKEILKVLGRKSFLQDSLDNYQIIMRKGDLQRELVSAERPIIMQKRLLEKAGYTLTDHIDQEGQDDNSYLCRFTFVPVKVSGLYSLDNESGFEFERMNKFSNIDLSGRSLVTIPIVLYKKSSDIVSLNLSRNLSLDVPRDFVSSCTHLKEIRYTGNEARSLPLSFSLASRLQVLDVAHNQIEQLDNADLDRLTMLCSLRIANNRLSHLPLYFTKFKYLRSLNLSSNSFKQLPSFFGELRGLVDLDISFNALESWPPVEELESLERFWATNNNLNGPAPDEYINLRNLKDIDVRFNKITNIDVISRLPNLEQCLVSHNSITRFEGFFQKLRYLQADHNPMTHFDLTAPTPSLTNLNLASNIINELSNGVYEKMPNLAKLNLDKNLISNLGIDVGRLSHLEVLSIAKNPLMTFPPTIGCLQDLRKIDARECNIKRLPAEIWFCCRLEELNMASNVLDDFPKLTSATQPPVVDSVNARANGSLQSSFTAVGSDDNTNDERRPSQTSGSMLSFGSSPANSTRKNSVMSGNSTPTANGRKPSVISRQTTDLSSSWHKDSRMAGTFAGSLRSLCLAYNRLRDDVFDNISALIELKSLNLSYNELDDIPSRVLRRWPNLQELYLSGNELSTLPTEDLGSVPNLRSLYLNGNKFQTLPAELAKITKLLSLDVSNNSLKYNVANWPYDWNWVWNPNLRYLNFSGNRRLEIKPQQHHAAGVGGGPQGESLTSFNSLQSLRILGLIDVTLTIPNVPEETDDRRVRTTGSLLGGVRYGMADSLGKTDHLSTLDLMIPKFRGHDSEFLMGMFDGQASSSGGSRVARFLQENFKYYFAEKLSELLTGEDPGDALRRSFLRMNKDLITFATSNFDATTSRLKQTPITHAGSAHALTPDDRSTGGVATVLFIQDMQLYVANVGNVEAMLMPNDGSFKMLTTKDEPANASERERIRDAGGYVSRYGKLNDALEVSRAFGYAQHLPAVMAAPHITHVPLREQDETILVASKEFWDYVTPDLAIDLIRRERGDPMHCAQMLRDAAIAYGAGSKIMVMVIGIADLKKSSRSANRNTLVLSPSHEVNYRRNRPRVREQGPDDTRLALLDREVDAPTGDIALVFTDIKSSTALWEKTPVAMRSAIRMHNELMRRQLRIIGGYEVKTEGDAFMIAFPTPTSALLWTFAVQNSLLTQDWPTEILDSVHGEEVQDDEDNTIYRGLSVRMGIHWGSPVCEPDPITRRMDYFGPMVNRAARIQGVADGGEITCSADFIAEIERALELYVDSEDTSMSRSESNGSDETVYEDPFGAAIRRDLRALSQQGFEVKELGETKLKGIENPEILFQIFPYALAGRQKLAESRREAAAAISANVPTEVQRQGSEGSQPGKMEPNTKLNIEAQNVWDIWTLSLRLEMICSALEEPSAGELKSPETAILERMRAQGGEVSDKVLVQFMDHLVCRIETCVNTLTLRNLVRPFNEADSFFGVAGPMKDLFSQLASDLQELHEYRRQRGLEIAEA